MPERTSIYRDSKEYLRIPVTPPAGVTIAAQVVEVAVLPVGQAPIETDWQTASWSGNTALLLIGPGLTPGQNRVWLRVTDSPEIPVLLAGTITVT